MPERTMLFCLDWGLFFQSDQSNEDSSRQSTGRCSKNCASI